MTPSEYFDSLKDSKQEITSEKLRNSYDVILKLAEKYQKTGQTKSLGRLKFLAKVLGEEEKLIELGVTTFIYRQNIEDYIDNVNSDVVKIIELKNYMREIPEEAVEVVEKTKDIFDEFYVVFTDYTKREERKIAQERREKDPILFGCFRENSYVGDRFYFLADWVDSYCDLTLDRMIAEYKASKKIDPSHSLEAPQTHEELLEILDKYKVVEDNSRNSVGGTEFFNLSNNIIDYNPGKPTKRPGFFNRITSIFRK